MPRKKKIDVSKINTTTIPHCNVSVKNILRPRLQEPRWASVSEYGDIFHGNLCLGNGTTFPIVCGFTFNRHFFIGLLTLENNSCYMFPAGFLTNPDQVAGYLGVSETDATNLSDFINSQLDGGLDVYLGEYVRKECA